MEVKSKPHIVTERTEEVTDIISRMPTTFAKKITILVCSITALMVLLAYVVQYPDIVTGSISVSAESPPLELVVEQSGRLRINHIVSQQNINSGQLIAWIDNPTDPNIVEHVSRLLKTVELPVDDAFSIYNRLPKKLNLGELNTAYFNFVSSLRQLADHQRHKLYDAQEKTLGKVLNEQKDALETLKEKEQLSKNNLDISDKFLDRYNVLLEKKVISQGEYDKAISSRISVQDQLKSSFRSTGAQREEISKTENSIQENRITKQEKELQLEQELLAAFNDLLDKIVAWEKKYTIRSPINGQAQFVKFWTDNQFVQAGQPIFSIVPKESNIIGKVILPINGAGKVKVGQEVIVKLADFPYMEYGYVKALIQNISLVSGTVQMGAEKPVDSYLLIVSFPKGLITNYGTKLDFKFETKGSAEIITKKRRLIERFFDNLKYIQKESD
jgi:multidrug efflux pump subunit AcrA (membrane-fusion protein)